MIRLICDNCERPLDVPEEFAGQKFKCPHCGDVNLVPPAGEQARPAPVARGPATDASAGPEVRVLLVRQAMFRARPLSFVGLVLLALAGAAGAAYFGLVAWQAIWFWASVVVLVASLIVLGFWKISTLDHSLEITTRRTIETKGIFSRATSEVRHQDVRNIQLTQTFMQRVFNVGTVGIASAGQEGVEILARDMPGPRRIRDAIDKFRSQA